MIAEVVLTGGCGGHDADCRCYCESPDVHVEFSCPKAIEGEHKEVRKGRWQWVRNRQRCKQKNIRIGELSDQNSIARWLTEVYKPEMALPICATCNQGVPRHGDDGLCMDVDYAGGQRWSDTIGQTMGLEWAKFDKIWQAAKVRYQQWKASTNF
jgi:hypothetical protein